METKRIVFIGVGGQGNLLASRLLGEASLGAGIPAVVSEIHGMAPDGYESGSVGSVPRLHSIKLDHPSPSKSCSGKT